MKLTDKIGLVIIVVSLVSIFAYGYYTWVTHGELRYTIGVLKGLGSTRSGWRPIFKYSIQNATIEKSGMGQYIVTPDNLKSHVDKRYYVTYDPSDYNYARILLDYPVPDSIQSAPPPNGWDSIPGVGQLENPLIKWGEKSPPIKKK